MKIKDNAKEIIQTHNSSKVGGTPMSLDNVLVHCANGGGLALGEDDSELKLNGVSVHCANGGGLALGADTPQVYLNDIAAPIFCFTTLVLGIIVAILAIKLTMGKEENGRY